MGGGGGGEESPAEGWPPFSTVLCRECMDNKKTISVNTRANK